MSLVRSWVLGIAAAMLAGGTALAQAPAGGTAPTMPILSGPVLPAEAPSKKPTLSEGVAAVVNNEIISTYDLRQRVLMVIVLNGVQPTEQNVREIEREALRSLVDERLQMQEIKSIEAKQKDIHLEPSGKELEQQISAIAQNYGVKRPQLLATLNAAGVSTKTLEEQITVQMSWQNYIGGRFHGTVRVGDDRINQEQARINASAAKAQYQVSEILIDSAHAGSAEQALTGATQLVEQIKQGAPFAAVARQFSALPTAANGGDAGWLTSGELSPTLESVLATMRPGQVSDPVPTPEGVYILQLRDKHAGSGATLVSLKQAAIRIPTDPTAEQTAAADAKLDKLRAAYKGCDDLEKEAAKLEGVVAGDLGETDVGDLSAEFRQVVDKLKVGEIGGPVRTKAGVHLVALCGRRASGARAPTRDEIEGKLENEQLSMIARRYLRDLRNSATIESR